MTSGNKVFESRGLLAALVILPALASAVFSRPLVRVGTWVDVGLSLVAWATLCTGIFLRLWATLYVGGRKGLFLVIEGPYAMCRHPLYVGSCFIVVSLAVFLESRILLAAVALTALIYAAWVIPSEERHAITCFGDQYLAYRALTPRFLPGFSRLRRPGMVEVKVAELLREMSRDFGCIMAGALATLVAHFRVQPWWPTIPGLP